MYFINQLFNSKLKINFESALGYLKGLEHEILIGLGVLFVVYIIGRVIQNARSNFPPGPMGLPIVGYLPFLSKSSHIDFMKLGQKYGDVFSVRLGSKNVVILHGAEVIREAFAKPEFLAHPAHTDIDFLLPKSPFFASDVHSWKEQRRFVVQSMKDLGLGKSKIEDSIQDEISHFLEVLRSHNGNPMDLKEPLSPSMSNNISALVFGKRMEYDNKDRQLLDKNLDEANDTVSQTSVFTFFPWLSYIPFSLHFLEIKKGVIAFENIRKFFREEIEKHRKTLDPSNIRDFIDSYIVEMLSRQQKDPKTTFSEDTLVASVIDIFAAGSETVRTSILWTLYTMAAFPEVQKRVQQEIMEVLGSEKSPSFTDQKDMPYTQAVLLEVLRWRSIVPLNLIRSTMQDTTVGGYDIPKDTFIIANFWNVHHDTRYWTDPESFKPERFLNADGTAVVKSRNYMPFSLGSRTCPGETMAHMEIFLYFTSILQKFDLAFPAGFEPTFEAKLFVTLRMDPYKIRFIPK